MADQESIAHVVSLQPRPGIGGVAAGYLLWKISEKVLAEVFALYGMRSDIWRRVEKLDVTEQQALIANGGRVKLRVVTPDGASTCQLVSLLELKEDELRLVFGDAGLRDPDAQDAYLNRERRRTRQEQESLSERIGCAEVDPVLGIARCRNGILNREQVALILRKLGG